MRKKHVELGPREMLLLKQIADAGKLHFKQVSGVSLTRLIMAGLVTSKAGTYTVHVTHEGRQKLMEAR